MDRVRSSPVLSSDVNLKSCLLSFQVFDEVLCQPQFLEAGHLREPLSPTLGLLEELGLLGGKERAP